MRVNGLVYEVLTLFYQFSVFPSEL